MRKNGKSVHLGTFDLDQVNEAFAKYVSVKTPHIREVADKQTNPAIIKGLREAALRLEDELLAFETDEVHEIIDAAWVELYK
jgi:hypothetical protein